MSPVKCNLVKFHSGTSMKRLHSASTCSAIQLLVDTCRKDYTQTKCSLITCKRAIKNINAHVNVTKTLTAFKLYSICVFFFGTIHGQHRQKCTNHVLGLTSSIVFRNLHENLRYRLPMFNTVYIANEHGKRGHR